MPKLTPIIASTSPQGSAKLGMASEAAFGAGEAQGLQSIGKATMGLGEVLKKHEDNSAISETNRKLSEIHATMAVEWNDEITHADPNDAELAQRFNEKWKQRIDEVGAGIDNRAASRHFENTAFKIKDEFFQTTMIGQANLKGMKDREDWEVTGRNLQISAANSPTSLRGLLQAYDDDMKRRVENGSLRSDHAVQMRNKDRMDITMSAINGMVEATPDLAEQSIRKGDFDDLLSGDAKKHALGLVEQKRHRDQIAANARDAILQKQKKIEQEKTQQDLFTKLVDGDLTVPMVMNSNLDAFGSGSKDAFVNMLKAQLSGETVKTDMKLWARLNADANTPQMEYSFLNENITSYADRLSPADMKAFIKMQNDLRAGGSEDTARSKQAFKVAEDELAASGVKLDLEEKGKLHGAIRDEVAVFVKAHKRSPSEEEMKELSAKVITARSRSFIGYFTENKFPYQDYKPGQPRRDIGINDLPKQTVGGIKEWLRSKGKATTPENIMKVWTEHNEKAGR